VELEALLDARDMSDSDFARKVGLSKAMVSLIKHRKPSRLPRTIAIDAWAKALKLNAQEHDQLLFAALLAWSPAELAEYLKSRKFPGQQK
jgi:transcriptional regulator with XRE-family HTH domain